MKRERESMPLNPRSVHERFMQRALQLAALGGRDVMPNPMVGAVVVVDEQIIAEGYHRRCGGPHAEVFAIESIANGPLLERATLYVSLEPCSHFGKTPPCADLIVRSKIPTVVVGSRDPFPEVSGRGIQKLRDAGITVIEDVCRDECIMLNRRFMLAHHEKRPYVVLKWAQTADGYIARTDGTSKWISSDASRTTTHQWRSKEMAVLVGTNTARIDNPELTVRHVTGENPLRVVLDRALSLPKSLFLFDDSAETIVLNAATNERKGRTLYKTFNQKNPLTQALLDALYEESVVSVIVEGGSKLLSSFIEAELWDEARIFVSPTIFTEGVAAPQLKIAPYQTNTSGVDKLLLLQHPTLTDRGLPRKLLVNELSHELPTP
jgi:diaminohydroxyphosphoribosylaminopyrimidine deaminase/5-amino-6-(5-phosphoribosylamino)uracil reductase